MKCSLEIIRGFNKGHRVNVAVDLFTIGREKNIGIKTNDLDFDHTHDSKVSRSHAQITRTTDGFILKEISGKNNTWINSVRSTGAVLKDDDIIIFGKDGPSVRVHIHYDKKNVSFHKKTASEHDNKKKDAVGRRTLLQIIGLERQRSEKGTFKLKKHVHYIWAAVITAFVFTSLLGWRGFVTYTALRETDSMIQKALADGDSSLAAMIEELKKHGKATDTDISSLKAHYNSLRRALPTMNSVLNKARKSVVRINTVYDIIQSGTGFTAVYEGKPCRFTSLGSGFCIKENGYIITNAHLVSPWIFNPELANKKLSGKRFSVSVTFDGEDKPYIAEVKNIDAGSDLAILKIQRDKCPYLKFTDTAPSAGEQVVILGFPAVMETGDHHADCMVIGGNISKVDPDGAILYSMVTHSGNSGGPVILSNGNVAAVHSSGLYTDKGSFFTCQGSEDMMVMSTADNKQYKADLHGTVEISKLVTLSDNKKYNTNNISKGISAIQARKFIERYL